MPKTIADTSYICFLPRGLYSPDGVLLLAASLCVRPSVRPYCPLSQELLTQPTRYFAHIIVTIGRCARSTFLDPIFNPTSPGRPPGFTAGIGLINSAKV